MEGFRLAIPDGSMADEIWAYRQAMLDAGSSMDGCGSLRRCENPADWLAFNARMARRETVPENLAPAAQYVYLREADGRIVGMLDLRYEMNDFLRRYGGHVGYSVRPDERRKGYATAMLADALVRARERGLERVMVSCLEDNEGSRRTILKNGGAYEATVYDPKDGIYLERYWIELDGRGPRGSVYDVVRTAAPDWMAIPAVKLTHQPWLAPCGVAAKAQMCHDGERIYVRMRAWEAPVRATLTGPLEQVCNDSCLEFFFAPDPGDERYLNFEWNPLGTLYLGFGAARGRRVRQIVPDAARKFALTPLRMEQGWGIAFSVPADFVRLYFPGFSLAGEAAGNFYKCGDQTDTPHYLAWAPLTSAAPDFHRRQDFGRLRFEP